MKVEGKQVKRCPFLDKWCDDEVMGACAIAITLKRAGPEGIIQRNVCTLAALAEILSEINLKTAPPPSVPDKAGLVLPFMGRG